jgi:signal transduction histidine kinase/CHASE3 domain sensor protein
MTKSSQSRDDIFGQRQNKVLSAASAKAFAKAALAAKHRIAKVILVALLISLIGTAWMANQSMNAAKRAEDKVAQTFDVLQKITSLMSSLKDAENGQRGFIITGKPDYLKPYHASLSEISKPLAELNRLTLGNPVQHQRINKITQLVKTKLEVIATTIEEREAQGFLAARNMVMALPGLPLMNEIRMLVADAEATQLSLLQDYAAENKTSHQHTNQTFLFGSALSATALLLLLIRLRGEMRSTRQAQTGQQISEEKYRYLFNSIKEGFCVVEMIFDAQEKPIDHRFLETNPAFEKHTGIHDAIGRTILEFAPDHDSHWFENLGQVAKTGIAHRFANDTKALDDRLFDVYAFRLGGAQNARVAILFSDVTKRRQSQDRILRLSAGLEARVRHRTVHLETANHELESFSYAVSHDLRSPLNTISMLSHLLAEAVGEKAGVRGTQYLSRIHDSTLLMGELIEGLLSLTNLSRDTLQVKKIDLSAIARKKLQECQELEPNRQVQIRIQDGMRIDADPRMMAIVIQNLLGNAWKFTAMQASALIEMGSRPGRAGVINETVYFVKDNGAGFNMASASNLFSAFERLHSSSDFSGTGIGLATAKRAIERQGGSIWAEGKENAGATFYFTLNKPPGH